MPSRVSNCPAWRVSSAAIRLTLLQDLAGPRTQVIDVADRRCHDVQGAWLDLHDNPCAPVLDAVRDTMDRNKQPNRMPSPRKIPVRDCRSCRSLSEQRASRCNRRRTIPSRPPPGTGSDPPSVPTPPPGRSCPSPPLRSASPGLATRIRARSPTGRVALLLPLSGRQQSAGMAVRDGFIAAHLDSVRQRSNGRCWSIDVALLGVGEAHAQAQNAGAGLIVGPLLRESVQAIEPDRLAPMPVLALNYLPDGEPARTGFWQFGLAPEDEAREIAARAIALGQRRAISLAPDNSWGRRLQSAFEDSFTALGGQVVRRPALPARRIRFLSGTAHRTRLSGQIADICRGTPPGYRSSLSCRNPRDRQTDLPATALLRCGQSAHLQHARPSGRMATTTPAT